MPGVIVPDDVRDLKYILFIQGIQDILVRQQHAQTMASDECEYFIRIYAFPAGIQIHQEDAGIIIDTFCAKPDVVEIIRERSLFFMRCCCKKMSVKWAESHTKHNQSKTKLYRKYKSILNRCYNTNNRQYKRYGGRGIDVCEEWKNSFEAFRDWAYSNGYDPQKDGHYWSVDRIDNNKGYSPRNCRFTTAKEQMRNREITSLHEFCGCLYSASEFADLFGITDKSFVYRRLQKGETLEYILDDWTRMHKIPDYLIEVETYAEEKNVTPASVKRWINQGKIKGEKVGRKWYVCKQQ